MKRSIKSRISYFTVGVALITGIIISAISFLIYRHYDTYLLITQAETNTKYTTDYLNTRLSNIQNFVRWCQNNNEIINFTLDTTKSNTSLVAAYDHLSDEYKNTAEKDYIYRILIFKNNGKLIQVLDAAHADSMYLSEKAASIPFIQQALYTVDYDLSMGLIIDPYEHNKQTIILPLIRPIYNPYNADIIGIVMLEINASLFSDTFESSLSKGNSFFLTIDNHTYKYESGLLSDVTSKEGYNFWNLELDTQYSPSRSDTSIRYGTNDEGAYVYYITQPMEQANCYVTQMIPAITYPQKTIPFFILLILILVVLMVGIIIAAYMNHIVTKPVINLQKRLEKVSNGDFTRDLSIESSDEFGLIGQRINNMAEDINLLITNRLAFEKERQDIEYQLLQSQINPHFLYNTLGSIKWMATVQNVPGIAKMTTALSRLLKSISKIENVNIPISLECSLLDDYFTIQKYRYGGSIEMKYEVEDTSLLDYSILRFTLQPIVENSIFHGIEPKETAGLITIRIFSPDHNKIQIDIIDNGIGMDSFTIDNLLKANTGCKSNFFKDLGISSVHKRLQYEFGSSYGLSFQSEVGKYTKTSILLPKILSETNVKGEIPSYDDINCR